MSEKTLNGSDLGRGYDDVDLFGLNEFGEPEGLSPIYGALTGVGVGTLAAIGARSFGDSGSWTRNNSEFLGLLASLAAGGTMAFFPSTRYSGWVAMAAGLANNGLRVVESYFSTGGVFKGNMGYAAFDPRRPGLGLVQAKALNGPRTPTLLGPPNPANARQSNVPRVHSLAARYGASASQ
jgi:hypothetical protein